MKRSVRVRLFWIIVSLITIGGMIIFTLLPLIQATGY